MKINGKGNVNEHRNDWDSWWKRLPWKRIDLHPLMRRSINECGMQERRDIAMEGTECDNGVYNCSKSKCGTSYSHGAEDIVTNQREGMGQARKKGHTFTSFTAKTHTKVKPDLQLCHCTMQVL